MMSVDPWFEQLLILGVYRVRCFHFFLSDNPLHRRGALLLRSGHASLPFSHMTHYLTHAGTPMTHTDSELMTHYLQIVPYDIITDVTMTHADSCLLTTYVIRTHS